MKYFGLVLLFAACLAKTAFGKSNLFTGWTPNADNEPYADLTARVGDTITFIWPTIDDQSQNVFIHPTNDCTQTGRIAIGNVSPTEYTFKPEDAALGGKKIFFANDIRDRCENLGMRLTVTVFPASDGDEIPDVNLTPQPVDPPTSPPVAPTEAPVFPTLPPVQPTPPPLDPAAAPVLPTDAPVFPTLAPTTTPVVPPTPPPTPWPTRPQTDSPTSPPISPSLADTDAPTWFPTESEDEMDIKTMRNLQMTLSGIDSFTDSAGENWAQETATFCTEFYLNDYQEGTFQTSIAVKDVIVSSNSRQLMRGPKRKLQTGDVLIIYDQDVSYANTGKADITEEYLAKSPFDTADQLNNFVDELKETNDPLLVLVTDASPVTFADETLPIPPTSAPEEIVPIPPTSASGNLQPGPAIKPKEKFGLTLPATIGIACGGGALLIIAILFCIYCRSKRSKETPAMDPSPPAVNVDIKPDEVSTLAGPFIPGNAPYGDRSIGTVDYDYTKAYEDRDHSISYAGGTLGSDTQDFSFPANAGATGAALGPYDDNGYGDPFQSSRGKVKEEILHIFAPPGKLGVVIDTPDDGAPVVHAVKETSVVVDKVMVGDKLIAVDDEDVRTLTAIKVSKLISRKSANPSRKLTILRITHLG